MSDPILSIQNLKMHFSHKIGNFFVKGYHNIKAVDGVSFEIKHGESIGLVGESGSGKTTIVRAILNLNKTTEGKIFWKGRQIQNMPEREFRELRRKIQFVFQTPLSSLNPHMTIGRIITEPLVNFFPDMTAAQMHEKLLSLMHDVGLSEDMIHRLPHEFSGGQCQRIVIARALILKPELLICDEPVSALDVSIRAQIMNLLANIQKQYGLTVLFISHDLSVVRYLCDRIIVLYMGKIMEVADSRTFFQNPKHPYSKSILAAVPHISDADFEKLELTDAIADAVDDVSPDENFSGCVYCHRCPLADGLCQKQPPLFKFTDVHSGVYCHHA